MNGAHWHLVLNHLPIIIPMVGLLVMVFGLLLKSEILKRAAYSIYVLGALTAIAAFFTGEGAEEVVEKINGIDERFIKSHEEVAEIFAVLFYAKETGTTGGEIRHTEIRAVGAGINQTTTYDRDDD